MRAERQRARHNRRGYFSKQKAKIISTCHAKLTFFFLTLFHMAASNQQQQHQNSTCKYIPTHLHQKQGQSSSSHIHTPFFLVQYSYTILTTASSQSYPSPSPSPSPSPTFFLPHLPELLSSFSHLNYRTPVSFPIPSLPPWSGPLPNPVILHCIFFRLVTTHIFVFWKPPPLRSRLISTFQERLQQGGREREGGIRKVKNRPGKTHVTNLLRGITTFWYLALITSYTIDTIDLTRLPTLLYAYAKNMKSLQRSTLLQTKKSLLVPITSHAIQLIQS